MFIDEFLSIIDFANDAVRDPLMDNQERDKSRSAVMSMWRNLKRITSEARKYGVYVIVTMTDPTKRNLGEDGERVLTQMTRVATGMNSGASCRVFLDIPAKSEYPQGTVGFEAGEFLINQGGVMKHGRGFNPTAEDFETLFNAVNTPIVHLPAGLARLATTATLERMTRPEPVIIPAPPTQVELDAERLEPWAAEWAMTGKKTSRNRVALFLANREDLAKADSDQYGRADLALEYRAQRGCNWAKGLLGYVTADSRAQVMA